MPKCANDGCEEEFERRSHNQIYHNDECCRVATNRRIMEKYYEKKAILNGIKRSCGSCGASLSRYNLDEECWQCLSVSETEVDLNEVFKFINIKAKPSGR